MALRERPPLWQGPVRPPSSPGGSPAVLLPSPLPTSSPGVEEGAARVSSSVSGPGAWATASCGVGGGAGGLKPDCAQNPLFTLLARRLECERGTEVLPTETWVFVCPEMRRDHQCLLGIGGWCSCSLLSGVPLPTSSSSFPSFKRRECPQGLQATLQSLSPRVEVR